MQGGVKLFSGKSDGSNGWVLLWNIYKKYFVIFSQGEIEEVDYEWLAIIMQEGVKLSTGKSDGSDGWA